MKMRGSRFFPCQKVTGHVILEVTITYVLMFFRHVAAASDLGMTANLTKAKMEAGVSPARSRHCKRGARFPYTTETSLRTAAEMSWEGGICVLILKSGDMHEQWVTAASDERCADGKRLR